MEEKEGRSAASVVGQWLLFVLDIIMGACSRGIEIDFDIIDHKYDLCCLLVDMVFMFC